MGKLIELENDSLNRTRRRRSLMTLNGGTVRTAIWRSITCVPGVVLVGRLGVMIDFIALETWTPARGIRRQGQL